MSNATQETQRIEVDLHSWDNDRSYRWWMMDRYPGKNVVFVAKAGTTEGSIHDAGSIVYKNEWSKTR